MDGKEPEPLGPMFDQINQQMAMLHLTWRDYRELFATTEARFNLLQSTIPGLALVLHELLRDSVILGICRLCDPTKSTVTVKRLVESLKLRFTQEQTKSLEDQQTAIAVLVTALKAHRDKRITHNNRRILDKDDVLPPVTRGTVDDTLKALRKLMNDVSGWLRGVEMDYHVISVGDAEALISCLQRADRLGELQDDHWMNRLLPEKLIEKLSIRQLPPI